MKNIKNSKFFYLRNINNCKKLNKLKKNLKIIRLKLIIRIKIKGN